MRLTGIVFALDGMLLGAHCATFTRNATVPIALVGFLPLIWLSLVLGRRLLAIWSGLSTYIVLRLSIICWRAFLGAATRYRSHYALPMTWVVAAGITMHTDAPRRPCRDALDQQVVGVMGLQTELRRAEWGQE